MALLEVRDLASGYGELQVLWGVDLDLDSGLLTSLVGSNGAGKTTLLRSIMGRLPLKEGTVVFKDEDVGGMSAHEKAGRGLILVPEGRQLFTSMTVEENLEMGATVPRAAAKAKENREKVYELFPRLKERAGQKAGTLSGGEQQMCAVARGIMSEPEILMVDELSLGLAPVLALNLFKALKLLREEGMTILLVEQNVHLALKISDYAYVLSEGRVSLHGTAAEVEGNQEVRKAYLGI